VSGEALCRASPSLALVKYWGKSRGAGNRPATPSLAVTLGGVHTETRALVADADSVRVNGEEQEPARYAAFFDALRRALRVSARFRAESANSFPSSAGLASSSSGFAALAGACARAAGAAASEGMLSEVARVGSASAARSVFGGFVLLPAGARRARPLFGPDHWPELRIVVAVTARGPKAVSSRAAMEETRRGSPYYRAWLSVSAALLPGALRGLERRDLELLGETARRSYSLMHAAILGSDPPILYWLPDSVAVIRACAEMRSQGVGAWETMDAGPQVKILCLERDAATVSAHVQSLSPAIETITCAPGPGLTYPAVQG
jgi:diphosphomevalonate decarboxylase